MLQRREIAFSIDHSETGSTPPRAEVRRAVASELKTEVDKVFMKRLSTKTGTHVAVGIVNVYDSMEHAKQVEPEYIVKRNIPPEKPKEEVKE